MTKAYPGAQPSTSFGTELSPTTRYLLSQLYALDEVSAVHSLQVGEVAAEIATAMGIIADRSWLYEAGVLHDIGKLHIAPELLHSNRFFGPRERQAMQLHVRYTAEILKHYHYEGRVVQACIEHHERLDGSGYPAGARGSAITLAGRILAVADVFSALVSPRPYRGALTPRQALDIILQEAYHGRLDADIAAYLTQKIGKETR
ncbi:3'3'-cGAMP-specific phosphodiesterase 1 [Neomoorella glycerini]|uniref:3'3'-cGAMP-specific phosphodiesterase 1 n=1 Tax=Neomoorella glycerini TaxID=55779 RepID=A0A6I5ZLY4_9FIRM|nr:HD domain-containing phosphohydrolase [Moorella glycerini]QGP90884.1 3'3'-cGAMP-specific phosphodiesterase 1 [Moorella glycerini]